MKLRFSGNLALVLGGSSDAAIVSGRLMLESGIKPILSYRNPSGLEKIEDEFLRERGKIETVHLDFKAPQTLANMEEISKAAPDFLVDFAHEDYERYVCSARTKDIYSYFEANVSFRAAVLKRVGRAMLSRKKGRCVFVSSVAATSPNLGQGFYAAAKLASEALYKALGTELGSRGITAVVLRPGYVDAGRGRRYLRETGEKVLSKVPMKRALTVPELAENVLFLLSDSASGINATEIALYGGLGAGKAQGARHKT